MTADPPILFDLEHGESLSADQLLPFVYAELRRLAARKLAHEKFGQTLDTTALVHEAYLRLGGSDQNFANQKHFLAAASRAMHRILVENARRKSRVKHGGLRQRVEMGEHDLAVEPRSRDILALDEALSQFALEDPESAQIVEMHFFGGLSIEQVADVLGVSRATAYRQWSFARAWLRTALGE